MAAYDQGIFAAFTHIFDVLMTVVDISNIFTRLNEAWDPNVQGKKALFDLACKRSAVLHSPSIFQAIESAFHGCLRERKLAVLKTVFGTILQDHGTIVMIAYDLRELLLLMLSMKATCYLTLDIKRVCHQMLSLKESCLPMLGLEEIGFAALRCHDDSCPTLSMREAAFPSRGFQELEDAMSDLGRSNSTMRFQVTYGHPTLEDGKYLVSYC